LDRWIAKPEGASEELIVGGSGDRDVKLEIRAFADLSARYRRFHPLQRVAASDAGVRFRAAQ
jgi:Iap family predicted aminopeptidase